MKKHADGAHGPTTDSESEETRNARVVESALFSAGRPLAVDEISETTGVPKDDVRRALKRLHEEFAREDTALEVGRAGDKWAMQLKARWAPHAAKLAPMEIPNRVLKTLALIAYHQPLLQSELKDMIGTKVYDHVGELVARGLVLARDQGVSKLLTTSPAFPEYFGIPATDYEQIRTFLAQKVGITPSPKKSPEERNAIAEAAAIAEAVAVEHAKEEPVETTVETAKETAPTA
ncbi:MAG TPA: SMC-Scp complex subunit ScpB [Candidatus Thermoplasmatota archaeon]|nr:SMC-Scp complex subunit ScpB [Candidatus Thermoplasmatota archaeon]